MTEILDGREGPYARIQMEWYDAEEERRRLKWEGGDGLTSKRGDGDRAETRGGETIWGRDGQRAKLNGPKPEEAEEDLSGLESARTVPSDVSTSTEEPELELRGGAGSSRHRHYGHDWDPITLDCFSENDVYDDIEAYDREMLHRIRQQEPLDRERLHETRRQDLFDRERPCEMRQPSTVEPHSFRFDQQQHQESQSRRHDYYDDCRYCDRGENGLYNARQSGDGHGFSSRRSQRPQTSDRRRNGHESSRHQRYGPEPEPPQIAPSPPLAHYTTLGLLPGCTRLE